MTKIPANHRRALVGKTHWLYYRIEAEGSDVLIYWLHGKQQESARLPAA